TAKRLYMGGVLGGGTSLYGGALVRPSELDFPPGKHYGERVPRAIWDWPISYGELEPPYTAAGRLYGVAGCGDEGFRPLPKPANGFATDPLPLHPLNQKLIAANRLHGLRPFRLPLAIDPSRCLRCGVCAGYICPTGARSSAAQLLERATAAGLSLEIQTQAEVEHLLPTPGGEGTSISVLDRGSGRRSILRARRYALAAGAIGSSLLLLRSGIHSPLLGRNYMMHLSAIVGGFFAHASGAESSFIKQVGFADFYFGTRDYPHKMGIVQSLAVPGPLMAAKLSPFLPVPLRPLLRQRILPLAGIIEDLPNPANQISLGPNGGARLEHRFSTYDLRRRRRLAPQIVRILKRAGAVHCLSCKRISHEYVAHQCGTLRFGTDPSHAVLD